MVLWATDRAAYGRLARLITRGRRRAEKANAGSRSGRRGRVCRGLLAGVQGRLQFRLRDEMESAGWAASGQSLQISLESPFRDCRYRFGVSRPLRRSLLPAGRVAPRAGRSAAAGTPCASLPRQTGLPLVAAGDVHYHVPERRPLHDVLTAIRHGCTVAEARGHLFANAPAALEAAGRDGRPFAAAPDAVRRTVGDRRPLHAFRWTSCATNIPRSWPRRAMTPMAYLVRLAWAGAAGALSAGRAREGPRSCWSTSCS